MRIETEISLNNVKLDFSSNNIIAIIDFAQDHTTLPFKFYYGFSSFIFITNGV